MTKRRPSNKKPTGANKSLGNSLTNERDRNRKAHQRSKYDAEEIENPAFMEAVSSAASLIMSFPYNHILGSEEMYWFNYWWNKSRGVSGKSTTCWDGIHSRARTVSRCREVSEYKSVRCRSCIFLITFWTIIFLYVPCDVIHVFYAFIFLGTPL